jgi:hypothetical protein
VGKERRSIVIPVIASHDEYVKSVRARTVRFLARGGEIEKVVRGLDAFEILHSIDLDPLADELAGLYSPAARGQPPVDPTAVLRSLILMIYMREDSITNWAETLKSEPLYAILSGFEPGNTPGVGTFYRLIDRFEDGPPNQDPRFVPPSTIRKRGVVRDLKKETELRHAERDARDEAVTEALVNDLLERRNQPRPKDMLRRIEDLLMACAVVPSINRGLIPVGAPIPIAGDGSTLPSGASSRGRPTCDCRAQGIYRCNHPRIYSDHLATWGYDSYREVYYFGHKFYQLVVSAQGHDYPLALFIAPAHETDFTLGPKCLDRFCKTIEDWGLQDLLELRWIILDCGHDAEPIYRFTEALGADPVIPLNGDGAINLVCLNGTMIDSDGVPVCSGGKRMISHGSSSADRRIFRCPAKKEVKSNGDRKWLFCPQLCPNGVACQPDSKTGPTITISRHTQLRLYPQVRRDSSQYATLMAKRSACERSNGTKKEIYGLENSRCRTQTQYLLRLAIISIIEHAKAWQAERNKASPLHRDELIRQLGIQLENAA